MLNKVSIKSFAIIVALFALNATVAWAEEPATEAKYKFQIYNKVEEIPAELLEKIDPAVIEEAKAREKANPDRISPHVFRTKITSDVKKHEEKEILAPPKENSESLDKEKPKVTAYITSASNLTDTEIIEQLPNHEDYDVRVVRPKDEHDVFFGEVVQVGTTPVLKVASQNSDHAILEFDNKEGKAVNFEVVDMNGKIAKTITTKGGSFAVFGLANGTYFVKNKENPDMQAKIVIAQ